MPLVIVVYGGTPNSATLNAFDFPANGAIVNQLLASRGYAVLYPDMPQHGDNPMAESAQAVLPAIDRLSSMGIVDPDRVGVIGHSYGGYNTLSLIVQSTRFKAAVMVSGIGDIASNYGFLRKDGSAPSVQWAETGQSGIRAAPWENPQRYIQNSPFYYLDRVQTPLLIIHGTNDTTVPVSQADQVFVALRRLNKETVYVKYEGADHLVDHWSYGERLDYFRRVIAWFDDHLKKPQDKKPTEKQ